MALIPLIDTTELPPGTCREVVAAGRVFAVYNVDGQFHALDGICPHAGGPLGKGTLRGGVVTCPWHCWQFHVATGQHCLNARICAASFPTELQNGQVCIQLD
jgi:nitrite reductase/ring-hydroxylating ferredoxin subunit